MENTGTQRSKLFGLLLTGLLTIFSMSAYGQDSKTVKGEVLDLSCYMANGATGNGHKACAQGCLDKGLPAGILGEDGQVYVLVEDHNKADAYKKVIQHAAEDVKITGTFVDKNGVQSLIVEKVEVLD